MAADLSVLEPTFRVKLIALIQKCRDQGVEMRPYTSIRTPVEQGRIWRQSRTIEEINAKLAELRGVGAYFLADCIEKVGPQNGDHVTNAIPGLSWHQWGQAADCFWVLNSTAEWSPSLIINGVNGYRTYATRAADFGLTAGGTWPQLKDWPHVQQSPDASPSAAMSLVAVDTTMKQRFGG